MFYIHLFNIFTYTCITKFEKIYIYSSPIFRDISDGQSIETTIKELNDEKLGLLTELIFMSPCNVFPFAMELEPLY